MASLSELVAAADYQQRGKLAADPLYSAVSSFSSGLTGGAKEGISGTRGTKQLEYATKLLGIKAKIDEIKQKAAGQEAAKKALQAAGYLPLDAEDAAAARGVANSDIGTADIDPAAGTKTDAGKLAVLVNKANVQGGVEFDPAATINSLASGKNPGVRMKNKKAAPTVTPADKMRVRGLAAKMAKSAYAAKIQREGVNDQFGLTDPASLISAYVPTTEDIAKFEPEAHKYLYGKAPDAPAVAAPAAPDQTDPLDKVGDLGDVSSLWDLLKKK